MNKKIMGGIIAVVVIATGVGFYVTSKDADDSATKNSTASSETNSGNDSTPTFNPKATKDQSFVATLEGTNGGKSLKGTIESDGKGTIHFTGSQAEDAIEYYVASDGTYIFCQSSQCFKSSTVQTGMSPDDYEVTNEDIAKYQSKATLSGTESCPSGTCNVWEYNDDENVKTKIYIDKTTSYVSQVTGQNGADTFKIVYDFKNVSISIPTNIMELPSVTQ